MVEETQAVKRDIDWMSVLYFIHIHALGAYGLYLLIFEAKWMTVFFVSFIISIAALGITVGAHRLWAHDTYTAAWPLRLFLMIAQTLAGTGSIYDWVLMHRMHHKYYGTDKDPYNHNKGLWYSHVAAYCITRHPDHEETVKTIDMRDLNQDGFVWLQRNTYWILFLVITLLLPINAPVEYWDEPLTNSLFILGFFRLAVTLNLSRLVNSALLIWGLKPGEKFPVDDNSVFFVTRSYWANYHYLVPWDWKSGEYGGYENGWGTFFIKVWKELGIAEETKSVTSEDIREALYKAATKKITVEETLSDIKQIAEIEAAKAKLRFIH